MRAAGAKGWCERLVREARRTWPQLAGSLRSCDASSVRTTVIAVLAPLLFAIAPPASADEKDPAREACAGKTEGAPCATKKPIKEEGQDLRFQNEPGACQTGECCDLDYSGGSPPKSVCAPCLSCKPGGPPATSETASGGEASDSGDVEPPRTSAAEGDEPPATSPGKKGCTIDPSIDLSNREEPGLFGLGLLLLGFGLARRGRRQPQ
jgi:hypothetical protein